MHEKTTRHTYYSKNQKIKPIRFIEWRPIYVNLLKTQFVNSGKNAWKIFPNPHTEEAKRKYVEKFESHGHWMFLLRHSKLYHTNRHKLHKKDDEMGLKKLRTIKYFNENVEVWKQSVISVEHPYYGLKNKTKNHTVIKVKALLHT